MFTLLFLLPAAATLLGLMLVPFLVRMHTIRAEAPMVEHAPVDWLALDAELSMSATPTRVYPAYTRMLVSAMWLHAARTSYTPHRTRQPTRRRNPDAHLELHL